MAEKEIKTILTCHSALVGATLSEDSHRDAESMVRQAHHDSCHPEHVEGWIPAGVYPVLRYGAGMTRIEMMEQKFGG